VIRTQVSGSGPSPLSRCPRTNWSFKATIECQRSSEPESYDRWLGLEPDPHDLLITYASEPMTMWPISIRVNKAENDEPSLLDRVEEPVDVWAPL
jgi:hypothetical protein